MAHANIVAGYSKMFLEYPAIFLIKAQFQTFKRNVGLKLLRGGNVVSRAGKCRTAISLNGSLKKPGNG